MLLRFAQEKKPRPTLPPDPKYEELDALLDRSAQLPEQHACEKNRLQKCQAIISDSIGKRISLIGEAIASIEKRIEDLIAEDEKLKEQ